MRVLQRHQVAPSELQARKIHYQPRQALLLKILQAKLTFLGELSAVG